LYFFKGNKPDAAGILAFFRNNSFVFKVIENITALSLISGKVHFFSVLAARRKALESQKDLNFLLTARPREHLIETFTDEECCP